MPIATTTAAGTTTLSPAAVQIIEHAESARVVATAARANAKAQRAADTRTPLGQTPAAFAVETLPDPPLFADDAPDAVQELAPQQSTLVISVTILHRGRLITIASEGRSLDAFCDLLDKRFGAPS